MLLGDPGGVFVDPGEGLGAGGIVRDFLDGVGGGARRNGGHHKNDTADVEEFHGFLGLILARNAEWHGFNCGVAHLRCSAGVNQGWND